MDTAKPMKARICREWESKFGKLFGVHNLNGWIQHGVLTMSVVHSKDSIVVLSIIDLMNKSIPSPKSVIQPFLTLWLYQWIEWEKRTYIWTKLTRKPKKPSKQRNSTRSFFFTQNSCTLQTGKYKMKNPIPTAVHRIEQYRRNKDWVGFGLTSEVLLIAKKTVPAITRTSPSSGLEPPAVVRPDKTMKPYLISTGKKLKRRRKKAMVMITSSSDTSIREHY